MSLCDQCELPCVSVQIQSEHKPGQPPLPASFFKIFLVFQGFFLFLTQSEGIGDGPGVRLGSALKKPKNPQDFTGNQTLVWRLNLGFSTPRWDTALDTS